MAERICGCGRALDAEGVCSTCGRVAAWTVELEGERVAAATSSEVLLAEELRDRLARGLAEAPGDVPRYRLSLPKPR